MGSIVGDDDQLGLALAQGLQGLLVSEAVLAGFHDQRQTGVDAIQSLFLLGDKKENTKMLELHVQFRRVSN